MFTLFWGKVKKVHELEGVDDPSLQKKRRMPAQYETRDIGRSGVSFVGGNVLRQMLSSYC